MKGTNNPLTSSYFFSMASETLQNEMFKFNIHLECKIKQYLNCDFVDNFEYEFYF